MAFQSIAEFLDQCEPGTNIDEALAALREAVIAGETGLSGRRCSWDGSGRRRKFKRTRKKLPAIALIDLRFERLPSSGDFVLIDHDAHFAELVPRACVDEVDKYGGGVIWVKGDYDERLGPPPPVHGWGDLSIHRKGILPRRENKSEAFKNWLAERYQGTRLPPGLGPVKLAHEFSQATGISIHFDTIRRALGKKSRSGSRLSG